MPGKCIYRLDPYARLANPLFKAQCRSYSTHKPGRILTGDDLGPTQKDAHTTSRIRSDGKAEALALPPLLDPMILEKRSRWEQTKKRPVFAEFTPFQKKLWENPFAHVLASPVRQCRYTQISLPVALLTSLHPRPHPTTNDPWLLPVSLTTDKKQLGPPYRFIGRHFIAAQLGKNRLWKSGMNQRITEKIGPGKMSKLVWREDMPDFILELMRRRLFQKLSWNFSSLGRLMPVASPSPQDIQDVNDVSCVLIFRSLRTRADDVLDRLDAIKNEMEKQVTSYKNIMANRLNPHFSPEITHPSPFWYREPVVPRLQPRFQFPELEFQSTEWRGRKVPVYSLTDLLGEGKAQELITASKYSKDTCVIIKRVRHNAPLEILLMQLQSYIALPRA